MKPTGSAEASCLCNVDAGTDSEGTSATTADTSTELASSTEEVEELREPSCMLGFLLCLMAALEGADVQLLPCVFYGIEKDLKLRLRDLATMGSVQALCQTLSAPAWAALADQNILKRRTILILGSVTQGLITVLLAFVSDWLPMLGLRALNGVMLASLRPVVMGIVADATSEQCRGKVYGRIQLSLQLGMLIATMTATPLSRQLVLGIHGWRVAFGIVGLLGVLVGACASLKMDLPELPRSARPAKRGQRECAVLVEVRRLFSFCASPTFVVLIVQGLFGCMAMSSGTFGTMYFQMIGIKDVQASFITAIGQVTCAVGILAGGYIGDAAARPCRRHGRVLVAELSLAIGIPLNFCKFWGFPGIEGSFAWYAALTGLNGLLATWVVAGAKLPLLSEIVPADSRSAVMAWDGTIEGSLSALLGGPMVAILAECLFGFTPEDLETGEHTSNARALGQASAIMGCVPAVLSLCCWPLMHWTYPVDLRRIAATKDKLETPGGCRALGVS